MAARRHHVTWQCGPAYKKHLEGHKPALALNSAFDFLNREVAARGIEIPDPSSEQV